MLRGHSIRNAFAVLVTGIGLVLVPQDASSSPVLWTASAIWNDGGTLTGSFDFDAATNIYSNVALTTTPGADVAGTTYSSCVSGDCVESVIQQGITIVYDLQLRFLSPLTDAGGFVAFEGSLIGTKESSYEFVLNGGLIGDRILSSTDAGGLTGIAAVTPLPATFPLFASGLGALGLLGWRRKRNAAALAVA